MNEIAQEAQNYENNKHNISSEASHKIWKK